MSLRLVVGKYGAVTRIRTVPFVPSLGYCRFGLLVLRGGLCANWPNSSASRTAVQGARAGA